jgi:hypothetical protein
MRILASPSAAVPAPPPSSPARLLPPQARQQLAIEALTGQAVADLAAQQRVSRKFVYQQLHRAHDALQHAFTPHDEDPEQLLFWLPVTKPWLQQLVLGLTLICHSSLRGVTELLADLFDYPLALGTAHNILQRAVAAAGRINAAQDLSRVGIGAHDELFQARWPVLVGADVASTYCYLLSQEEHRDADTWGVRLLELSQRGLRPRATIADAAAGLRAGQALAWPDIPCRGDVFHAVQAITPLVHSLDNRAYEAIATRSALERRQARIEHRQGRKSRSLATQLQHARVAERHAVAVAEDVAALLGWLRQDVLAVAGPDYESRRALYDWIVAELRQREALYAHGIGPLRRRLENQRDDLLAFAVQLEGDVQALAQEFAVPPGVVREVLQVQAGSANGMGQWQTEAALWRRLGPRYAAVRGAVAALAKRVVRASSVIENLNSRLRNYFFLRRQLGPEYLALLQFFLNHRRFLRSEHRDRVGKSPAELLTGQAHGHWLELLGYTPFCRN